MFYKNLIFFILISILTAGCNNTSLKENSSHTSAPKNFRAAPKTIEVTVNNTYDDVEEHSSDGHLSTDSSDLEMTMERDQQTVGIRFTGVSIPTGATVTRAYIQFQTDEVSLGAASLFITAEDTSDSIRFAKIIHNVTDRATLSQSISWNPPSWNIIGDRSSEQKTSDLKTLVQAIINKSNWHSGNAITFIITGNGKRVAESFNGDSAGAPMLHVEYTTGNTPPPSDTTPPVITLNGANPINLNVGDTFNDPSATATDDIDGDITALIQTAGSVDTSAAGTYTITYTVFDQAGNRSTKTRTVIINDNTPPPPPSGDTQTVEITVNNTYDDVEEHNNDGHLSTGSSDLEMTMERDQQTIGIRFTGVSVPKGATVTRAYIQFQTDEISTGTASLFITAEDTPNSTRFAKIIHNVTDRATLSQSVSWNPPAWNSVRERSSMQRTSDLKALVQAIVNKSGWNSGNAITFIITGNGKRVAESFNGDSTGAPMLHVEYTTGNTPPPSDTTPPVITLNGSNPINLQVGDTFTDPGATATDDIDGDLTANIQTTGSVNTSTAGTYTVTYTVSDQAGNQSTKTRTVIVSDNAMVKTEYYVSPSGSDTNDGSLQHPFLTLQHAADIATPGTIVYVREGTYDVGDGLIFTKSGSADNYIVFTNYENEKPIIVKQNNTIWSNPYGATVALYGVSYMKFNGFILKEPVGNGIFVTNYNGTTLKASHYVEITNNVVYEQNANVETSKRMGYPIGVSNRKVAKNDPIPEASTNITISRNYVYSNHTGSVVNSYNESLTIVGNIDHYTIENNIIDSNYFIGLDIIGHTSTVFPMNSYGLIKNNLIIRNGKINQSAKLYTAALYVDGTKDTVIEDNTVIDNYGIGLVISQEDGTSITDNVVIRHNFVKNAGIYTVGVGTSASGLIQNVSFIENAIVQENSNSENVFFYRGNSNNVTLENNYFSFPQNMRGLQDISNANIGTWIIKNNIFNSVYAKNAFEQNANTQSSTVDENYQVPSYIGVNSNLLNGVRRYIFPSDTTPPIITLNGANPINLNVGETFSDLGATATDDTDGDLTSSIQTTGNVDTTAVGTYYITYTVSDQAGNQSAKTRTVIVSDTTPPPSGNTQTVEVTVKNTYDDVEEHSSDGHLSTSSSDLEMTMERDQQTIGIRFTGVSIPRNATITKAYIQFQTDEISAGAASLFITAENTPNSTRFIPVTHNVTDRITLLQNINWNPPAWNRIGERSSTQRTTDLKTLVQAIVDKASWHSGNALTFMITGNGKRVAESFNGDSAGAPMLHVEYTTENTPPSSDTTPPVITLNGSNLINLIVGETFTDPGATATDDTDGEISALIQTTGSVDTSVAGTYTVTYTVSDQAGNQSTKTRTVIVSDNTLPPPFSNIQTIEVTVKNTYDDVEEHSSDGHLSTGSSDLEMTMERDQQTVGIRFTNVSIPAGATVTKAYIQFQTDEVSTDTASLLITAEDTPDSTRFLSVTHNVTNRTTLPQNISWNPPAWNIVGERSSTQRTTDLKSIVQAIINKSGWHSGNALTFIITGNGKRVAESFNGDRAGAPMLHIEYTTENTPTLSNTTPPVITLNGTVIC